MDNDAALPDLVLPEVSRATKTIVVVDVVESVRLMQANEADVIDRWRRFVHEVRTEVLPAQQGRMVKSLGDGMLLEFETVPQAVAAAFEMQERIAPYNVGREVAAAMYLRMGVHSAEVVVDELDIYGAGVNLAARIATLAAPGEVVASIEAQELLLVGVDAEPQDLGECYVKHVAEPCRAFRLLPPGESAATSPQSAALRPGDAVLPRIAVLADTAPGEGRVLLATIAEDLAAALAGCPVWQVVSPLSAIKLAGRSDMLGLAHRVKVDYALVCSLTVHSTSPQLQFRLVEVSSQAELWRGHAKPDLACWLSEGSTWATQVAAQVLRSALNHQADFLHIAALPTLPAYALLLQAIVLLHRLDHASTERARAALEHLVERHPRSADARAWLAKWHLLRVAQVSGDDLQQHARRLTALLDQALAQQPTHALSLAIRGHWAAYYEHDLPGAERLLLLAISSQPSEPLARMFLAGVYRFQQRGAEAVQQIDQAQSLSPFDPLAYYFELFAAGAYASAGDYTHSLIHAERAVARNRLHLSSWIALIIAQHMTGQHIEARAAAHQYLTMRPMASVQRFIDRHAARGTDMAEREAQALLAAGLPR